MARQYSVYLGVQSRIEPRVLTPEFCMLKMKGFTLCLDWIKLYILLTDTLFSIHPDYNLVFRNVTPTFFSRDEMMMIVNIFNPWCVDDFSYTATCFSFFILLLRAS